jgi:hypothetical protein
MREVDENDLKDDGVERSYSSGTRACVAGLLVETSLEQLTEQVVLILHESHFASNLRNSPYVENGPDESSTEKLPLRRTRAANENDLEDDGIV